MQTYNEDEDEIQKFLNENQECYDRFTFDKVMRYLLFNGFDNEEAKDIILNKCQLSLITYEERIYNGYYEKISLDTEIAEDLEQWINEILFNIIFFCALKRKLND